MLRVVPVAVVLSLAALSSSCGVLFGACPPGSLESVDGRCFVPADSGPERPPADDDNDDDDDGEGENGEGEGDAAEGEGEGEGEGDGAEGDAGEGEGEGGSVGGGREVEPNGDGDGGGDVVVLVVGSGGEVTGEIGRGADEVDIVSVDVGAGRWEVRLRCASPDIADLDLFVGDASSETQECDEAVTVDVDAAGVLSIRVLSFDGETAWVIEIVAATAPTCDGDLCFGSCVDLDTDEDNCGDCGVSCAGGEACVDGACALQVNEQCNAFTDQCVPGACCISGFCQVAGGC